ncbi:MAG: hypothetical protein NWQ27_04260 [Crocinitomicaceae bacterium]|jgi:hypothetical protein|nr:hypothetical protein [Crocinitomicaceae bacterium]MDP5099185.1 hypothetical protein [Crocinitomicaceae bacterium]
MKPIIVLMFGLSSWSTSANLCNSNSSYHFAFNEHVNGELIIGIPNFNMKRYDNFVKEVVSVPGIRNIEYCSKNSVFLINYDHSVYANVETAFRAIQTQVKGYQLFHKIGASHSDLKKDC